MDLGTKGTGTTPWSRAGDGRLTGHGRAERPQTTAVRSWSFSPGQGSLPFPASAGAVPACHALAWRPRQVALAFGSENPADSYPYEGRVLGASYLGEAVEYLIECAAGVVKAQAPTHAPRFAIGSTLRFGLPLNEAVQLQSD